MVSWLSEDVIAPMVHRRRQRIKGVNAETRRKLVESASYSATVEVRGYWHDVSTLGPGSET